MDGKAVRGAAGPDGLIPYLLAAAAHGTGPCSPSGSSAPRRTRSPEFAPLLRDLNEYYRLAGHVITADAGHTVRAHAAFICGELLAHYVFTVKRNTPACATSSTPWTGPPSPSSTRRPGQGTAGTSAAPSRSWTPPRTSRSGSRTPARSP